MPEQLASAARPVEAPAREAKMADIRANVQVLIVFLLHCVPVHADFIAH